MPEERKVQKILETLDRLYPDARCSLNFSNPLELLVATILSAQCTDERVNEVTKELFRKYRSAEDYARVPQEELEKDIRPTGFYKNKAKSLRGCCKQLVEKFGGRVPADLDELVKLPGIGRKTANVVLGAAFGIPGIVVDTHVKRISRRLGLTAEKDPVKIEFDLMKIIPRERWTKFSHQMIYHGRAVCKARNPLCDECALREYCDYYGKREKKSSWSRDGYQGETLPTNS